MTNPDIGSYHYLPLGEVGAQDITTQSLELGPTAPLEFELWPHDLRDKAKDPAYVESKGEWLVKSLEDEQNANLLKGYTDTIGIASNLFALRKALQDEDGVNIASINIKGNSVDYIPKINYTHSPYDSFQEISRTEALADRMLRWRGRVPLNDVVSSTINSVTVPDLSKPEGYRMARRGRVQMDVARMLEVSQGTDSAEVPASHVANELNRMTVHGIDKVLRQSVRQAYQLAEIGGSGSLSKRVVESVHESGNKATLGRNLSVAAQAKASRKEQKRAFEHARQTERAAEQAMEILQRAPVIKSINKD